MNMVLDVIFRDINLLWKQILGSALIIVGFGLMLYGSRQPKPKHLEKAGIATGELQFKNDTPINKGIQALDESKTEIID